MCSPATAALEKIIQTNRSNERPPSQRASGEDHAFVSTSETATSTDSDRSSLMNLSFPLIEWSSVAGREDENEASLSQHFLNNDESDTSINSTSQVNAFLDRFLAIETDDLSQRFNDTNIHITDAMLPHSRLAQPDTSEAPKTSLHNSNNQNSNNNNTKRRLVRSIALGSKLALLDAQMDIVGDKRFRSPTTSCTYG